MRILPIVPRRVLKHGARVWMVRVPLDLRSAHDPQRRFFGSDKAAATAFAKQLAAARVDVSRQFLRLSPAEQSTLLNVLQELGVDNLLAAVQAWRVRAQAAAVPLSVVVADCLRAKALAGLRRNYLASLRCSLGSLVRAVGNKNMGEVSAADIAAWLNGNGWAAKTRAGYLKDVSTLFKFALKQKIVSVNPCLDVERPKVAYKGKPILAAAEWETILRVMRAHDPLMLGYLCPVLFGGLRAREARQVRPENFRNGVIDLDDGGQTKLNVRRAVKVSPQLAAWLALPGVCPGGGKNFKRRWEKLFRRPELAEIVWKKNCHRHSFCSYTLELHGAAVTARMANHSEATLFRDYANKVSRADAEKFAALMP